MCWKGRGPAAVVTAERWSPRASRATAVVSRFARTRTSPLPEMESGAFRSVRSTAWWITSTALSPAQSSVVTAGEGVSSGAGATVATGRGAGTHAVHEQSARAA